MTRVYVQELAGCTPTPLGHYLKALGVLRLVAEQADPTARGWWKDEHFWLATTLDEDSLADFLLLRYEPTPLLSPWNGGSGFYDQGKLDDPVAAVEGSKAERLEALREAVRVARQLLAGRTAKPNPGDEKDALVARFQRNARGPFRRWISASVATLESKPGTFRAKFPRLFGTGGNDGNLDYTDQFLRQLPMVMSLESGEPTVASSEWLGSSLKARLAAGLTEGAPGRQFDPGGAGGWNHAAGFRGRSVLNPWDYLLGLEGAVMFRVAVTRSADTRAGALAAPFAVESVAVGSGSVAHTEAGEEEQWFPLWQAPATLGEVQALLKEGRATLGRARTTNTVDFARSVSRLGVQRGVSEFVRIGYEVRNGNMHFAAPLGRWRVAGSSNGDLLHDIEAWLARLRRAARDDNAPQHLSSVAGRCDDAVLDVCRAGDVPHRWQLLLLALGEAERVFVATPKRTAKARLRPISKLSPGWVDAADDGRAEVRLALALASQHASLDPSRVLPVRRHWSPILEREDRFEVRNDALFLGPDLVCFGLHLEKDCTALVTRRVILSSRRLKDGAAPGRAHYPEGRLPLRAPGSCCAAVRDVMRFIDGATNDALVLGLARAFMALEWSPWERDARGARDPSGRIDPDYAILRLAHAPDGVPRGDERVLVGLDPEASRRLAAGDLAGAAAVALHRLRASGLRPVVRFLAGDSTRAHRLYASLAFPITAADLGRCADLVTKPYQASETSNSGERPTEGP